MILPTFYFATASFVGFRRGNRFYDFICSFFVGSLSRSHGQTRPASNGSLVASVGDAYPRSWCNRAKAEQPPRRVLASRHLLFRRFVCRVLIPPQKEEGGGIQNAGMRAPVGRCLSAGGVWCRVLWAFLCFMPFLVQKTWNRNLRSQKPIFLRGGSDGGSSSGLMARKSSLRALSC
jgi:hypothetical protein